MGKAIIVWLTEESEKQLVRIKEHIEAEKIKLPDIAKLPEYKGKINRSMVVRYCIKTTLEVLEEK